MATIDANVPVYRISTLSQRLDEFVTTRQFHVVLLSLFAGAGVLLAAIGIYGLIRHDVSQRTQEIGVRVALGASRRDVVILVLRNGLILTGMGMLLGWFASLALAGVMGSLVYGVSTRDPVTFLMAPSPPEHHDHRLSGADVEGLAARPVQSATTRVVGITDPDDPPFRCRPKSVYRFRTCSESESSR